MNDWKVILATMVIFGTGVVTGGLLVRHSERIRPPATQRNPALSRSQPASPGNVRVDFLRRMSRELGLAPAQREQVDKIIKESQDRTRKIMEPVAPEIRAEVKRAKDQFREVLTPEQQKRFDELLKQQQHPRDAHRPTPARERPAGTNQLETPR